MSTKKKEAIRSSDKLLEVEVQKMRHAIRSDSSLGKDKDEQTMLALFRVLPVSMKLSATRALGAEPSETSVLDKFRQASDEVRTAFIDGMKVCVRVKVGF